MKTSIPRTAVRIGLLMLCAAWAWANSFAGGVHSTTAPAEIAPSQAHFPMPQLRRPVFPDRTFDITRYGAVGDGEGGDGVISRFETRTLKIGGCTGARRLGNGSTAHVGAWARVGTALSWEFSGSAGKYRLDAEVAAAGEAALGVACGSTKSVAKIVPKGVLDAYRVVALGSVSLGAAAEHNLELKSQGKTWSEVRLRRVRLVPVQ